MSGAIVARIFVNPSEVWLAGVAVEDGTMLLAHHKGWREGLLYISVAEAALAIFAEWPRAGRFPAYSNYDEVSP
jgi:hypothetical protein